MINGSEEGSGGVWVLDLEKVMADAGGKGSHWQRPGHGPHLMIMRINRSSFPGVNQTVSLGNGPGGGGRKPSPN